MTPEMKVMDVMRRIKAGEPVMVTLPTGRQTKRTYSLKDGTAVSDDQFAAISDFLQPSEPGLFEGADPTAYKWGG